jgi:hypothetical protein
MSTAGRNNTSLQIDAGGPPGDLRTRPAPAAPSPTTCQKSTHNITGNRHLLLSTTPHPAPKAAALNPWSQPGQRSIAPSHQAPLPCVGDAEPERGAEGGGPS